MSFLNEWKKPILMSVIFIALFWLPVENARFTSGIMEAMKLSRWYAREHVLLCLIPAFFIAGAIGVFISQASVMKYLGPGASRIIAYGVASVSGSVLAVCSCTILPLFAGIWRMGAGLGPATAFLYSGPAINILAIILTARILGIELGIARAVGAVGFSVIIGLIMHFIYRKEEEGKAAAQINLPEPEVNRPLWKNAIFFAVMVAILVFANWGTPGRWEYRMGGEESAEWIIVDIVEAPFDKDAENAVFRLRFHGEGDDKKEIIVSAESFLANRRISEGFWSMIWSNKWKITTVFGVVFSLILIFWIGVSGKFVASIAILPIIIVLLFPNKGLWVLLPFTATMAGLSIALKKTEGEGEEWYDATWSFAAQILPLLFFGVLIAGFLLGRPGSPGFIPSHYVEMLVGDSPDRMFEITGLQGGSLEGIIRQIWPLWTNFFAAIFGAFMYFATLTEVPILQGLIGAGMGKGPALALLLAGPALSLPNMLVIRSVMGTGKTVVFCSLVVIMATLSGLIFGILY